MTATALASCGAVSHLRELSRVCVQQGGIHSGGNRAGEMPPGGALKISAVSIARLVQSLPPVASEDVCRGNTESLNSTSTDFPPNNYRRGKEDNNSSDQNNNNNLYLTFSGVLSYLGMDFSLLPKAN